MKFQPGQSGNPSGKPKGTLSKKTQLSRLLEPHAEELVQKVVELAKQGEPTALRLCIERLIPRVKEEKIIFDLDESDLTQTKHLLNISMRIITAITNGDITPGQGQKLASVIETHRKTIEIVDLEKRISDIENKVKNK